LREAQELGYAESDPTNDVEGYDAKYKLIILLAHAFGVIAHPDKVLHFGIHTLANQDLSFAKANGYRLKLIAHASKTANGVKAFVLPGFQKPNALLGQVNEAFNAVELTANFHERQFMKGRGAGAFPTAAAVVTDLNALRKRYVYGYKKRESTYTKELDLGAELKVYFRHNKPSQKERLVFTQIKGEVELADYGYRLGYATIDAIKEALKEDKEELFIATLPE